MVPADRLPGSVISPIHVLHVVDGLSLGGAERMLVEIANQTVSDGHRASVCVTRNAVDLASSLDSEIDLLVLGRRRRLEIRPLLRLAKWIRAQEIDVIHCHGRSSFSLLAALVASHQVRPPIVLHDHLGVQAHPRVPAWFRIAKRFLAAYVAVDDDQLAWARSAGIPVERMRVITNALDLKALERQLITGSPLEQTSDVASLVCIGGLRHEKAIDVLIAAIAMLNSKVMLHVIGGDADAAYAAHCRALVRQAGLGDRIRFEGPRRDPLALARTAALAVHGARSESGPLVLAEYAGLGIPFVSTRVGGIANSLAAAGVGRFVASESPRALANAIEEFLALPASERRKLGQMAIAPAYRMFNLSSVIGRWYQLYAEVRR